MMSLKPGEKSSTSCAAGEPCKLDPLVSGNINDYWRAVAPYSQLALYRNSCFLCHPRHACSTVRRGLRCARQYEASSAVQSWGKQRGNDRRELYESVAELDRGG